MKFIPFSDVYDCGHFDDCRTSRARLSSGPSAVTTIYQYSDVKSRSSNKLDVAAIAIPNRATTRLSANIDLIALHESTHFQVQSEYLTVSIGIHASGRYKCLCGMFVVYQIATKTGYSCRIMESARGMEFKGSVDLQVQALGIIGR